MSMFFKGVSADGKEVVFSGFIKRGAAPGKGCLATVGGIKNVDIAQDGIEVLDSPFYTILKEAKEEVRSRFVISEEELERLRTDYDLAELELGIKFTVGGKEETFPCILSKSATIPTSREFMPEGGERIPGTNRLRIHTATVVTLTVDLGTTVLTESDLKASFHAGDDAKSVHFINMIDKVTDSQTVEGAQAVARVFHKAEKMGILHHAQVVGHSLYTAYQKFYGVSQVKRRPRIDIPQEPKRDRRITVAALFAIVTIGLVVLRRLRLFS